MSYIDEKIAPRREERRRVEQAKRFHQLNHQVDALCFIHPTVLNCLVSYPKFSVGYPMFLSGIQALKRQLWIPARSTWEGHNIVMPEVFCRASMFGDFLASRQKTAGMTGGDAGMTFK